jgi:hypothetical protein
MENHQAWNLLATGMPLYAPSSPTTSASWQLLDELIAPAFGLADEKLEVPTTFHYPQRQQTHLQYNASELQQSLARSSMFTSRAFDGDIVLLSEQPPVLPDDDTNNHICVEVASHRPSWASNEIMLAPPLPSCSTLSSRNFDALIETSVD